MSLFRRRPSRQDPPMRDLAEAQVAVGSLSGIAPSEIDAHVLLVLDDERHLRVIAGCCDHVALQIVTATAMTLANRAAAAHAHGEDGHGLA